jgi:Flp pilus assembly pilin Flp
MTQLLVRALSALRSREEGQTLLEYALVISLVSVASIALLNVIGVYAPGVFTQVTADL